MGGGAGTTVTGAGSIELDDGALVLTGDIGDLLCDEFRTGGQALGAVDCIDARRVTLLAAVARVRGTGVPLWAGHRAVLGPLRTTGLDGLFDIRAPRT